MHALALMRFVAVIGVCWVHTAGSVTLAPGQFDYPNAGRFGSAFFTQCAVFLTLLKSFRRDDLHFFPYLTGRFRRVYVPFLLWTGIYIVAREAQFYLLGRGEHFEWTLGVLWNGSEYHLWFLPFIYVVGLALFFLGKLIRTRPGMAIPIAVACVPLGVLVGLRPYTIEPHTFDDSYMPMLAWNRLPSILWGIFFAIAYQFGCARPLRTRIALAGGLIVFVGAMIARGLPPGAPIFENIAGAGGMLIGLSALNNIDMPFAERLGKLTYGMYLCHLLFVGGIRIVCGKLWVNDTLTYAFVATTLAVIFSALLSSWLARTRGLRILVPA